MLTNAELKPEQKNIFWNSEERRLRSYWRVMIQFLVFIPVLFYISPYIYDLVDDPFAATFMLEIVFLLLCLVTVFLAMRFLDRRKGRKNSLNPGSSKASDFFWGFFTGGFAIATIFMLQYLAGWIKFDGFFHNNSNYSFGLALGVRFMGYFCVALMEEIFSRGYQLKNMAEGFFINKVDARTSVITSWILTSLVFGFLHADNPSISMLGLVNLFLIGAFFGFAYILTGSLYMPVGLHLAWNFFQGNVFGFHVSGFAPDVAIFLSRSTGPDIISGGEFGPESGLLTIFTLALGIGLIVLKQRKRDIIYFPFERIAMFKYRVQHK